MVTLSPLASSEDLSPDASPRGFRWSSLAWEVASETENSSETVGTKSQCSSVGESFSRSSSISASPTLRFSWNAPSPWISPTRGKLRLLDDRAAATLLQAHWKGIMVRRLHRKRFAAAELLVAHLRAWHLGHQAQKRFLRLRGAVLRLQRLLRRWRDREQELESSEMLVSCEAGPHEVMGKDTELQTPTKPGHLRPALRGAARRKLLGEEVSLQGGLRSPERRKSRKSCLPSPEKKGTQGSESRPVEVQASPSPMKEASQVAPRGLDSGALVLSELLAQGLLVEEHLDTEPGDGPSMDTALLLALDELRARGTRVCFVARIAMPTSSALAAAYGAARETLGPERLLWHGTSWECVPNIVRHGFNRAYAFNARHGSKLGRGVYFAEDPGYALRFAGKTQRTRAMLLAGVLPGKHTRGKEGLLEPPDSSGGFRFDSTCNDVKRPRVFCVFKDFQALPLYLVQVAMSSLHFSGA